MRPFRTDVVLRTYDRTCLYVGIKDNHVHLAHEEDLDLLFPDCEVGAMPPFGNLYGFPVVVDQALLEDREIVFNACTHTDSIRMKFSDFERLVRPIVAHIALEREPEVTDDFERYGEVSPGTEQ